jgi:periplasmic protein TonB
MSYSPTHLAEDELKKPFLWSVGFHIILFSSLLISAVFSHTGNSWGGPGGDNGVTVGLVANLPAIPLPRPDAVTTSRVVDPSKGLYKEEPKPKIKEIEPPDVQKIPEFTKEKTPKYISRPSKVLEDNTPPPTNAVPYGGGGAPALPYSQFSMSGGTQGALGFPGQGAAGGGDFAGRFPSYVDAVRNRISSNWLQSTVDPSIRWAPRASFSFQILRDGTITNVMKTQGSGNASVDNSALRALLSSSPLSALPSGYAGSSVTVEFYFDFRR